MKRFLYAVVALILLSFLCVPVSAAEGECTHITGAIPIGATMFNKPVDNYTHNVCYTCTDCGDTVVAYTEAHDVAAIDNKCNFCGYKVCTHISTNTEYSRNDADTHIKTETCNACGERTETTEAHEYANDVCVGCGLQVPQEGEDEVTPPITDTEPTTPPEESTPTTPDDGEDVDERIADLIVAWLEEHFADLNEEEGIDATITDTIVSLAKEWADEISLICAVIFFCIKMASKIKRLTSTVKTLNNNSVEIAEKSNTNAQEAAAIAKDFVDRANAILADVRTDAGEKRKLEDKLAETNRFINTAKLATIELANEVAELLVLANIPNAKKEELYSRHRAAVNAIAAAEETEVKGNVEIRKEA